MTILLVYLSVMTVASPATLLLGPAWRIGIAGSLIGCAFLISAWVEYHIPPSQRGRSLALRLALLVAYSLTGGFLSQDDVYYYLAGGRFSTRQLHAIPDLPVGLCYGLVAYLSSLAAALAVRGRKRRYWLGVGRRHCLRCGYDLTGNMSGRCPECGKAISASAGPEGPEARRSTVARTWRLRALAVITILFVLVFAIEFLFTGRPPSGDVIKQWGAIQPFLVRATEIEGHYRDYDTDSLVFTYTVSPALANSEFWEMVKSAAEAEGWCQLPQAGQGQRFERVERRGAAEWWSAEEVLVLADMTTGRVVVAWVQADSPSHIESFAQTSEALWAEREVWPTALDLADNTE